MSNGSTSKLTPELAAFLLELRAEQGLVYWDLVAKARAAGHKVSTSDISNWVADDREVEYEGETQGFRALWAAADEKRRHDGLDTVVEAAKDGNEDGSDAKYRKTLVEAMKWREDSKNSTRALEVKHSGEIGGSGGKLAGIILPMNKLFGEAPDEDPEEE